MTAPAPALDDTGTGSHEVDHAACPCDPDKAICGTDVSNMPWAENMGLTDLCVVCRDLIAGGWTCKDCGS